jgi:outer membrane protein assembly factor BamB
MNRRLSLLMLWMIVLMGTVLATAIAEFSWGVKEGDWMEYKITYTGTPPEKYQIELKIEVLNVQGTTVILNGTVKYSDGTQQIKTYTVSLESGVPDLVMVPANLSTGDNFYSGNVDIGPITISGVEERTYAGARRTVVFASVSQAAATLYWDRTTGVLAELSQSEVNYTMRIKASKTNMWQAQPSELPIDSTVFYILIIVAIAIVAFLVLRRRRRRGSRRRERRKPQKK